MADRVGQQLGNYRIIRLLGKGGFAEVYLGEHIYLNTQAAIKVLSTHLTDNELEQFLNEARTIARLEHTHIVRVLEFGVEDGVPFLVMSYAPNGTLRARHPRGTRIPLATVVTYIRQIANALQYAHEERVIHRDVKPENMLLARNDTVLLSDFGLATAAQSSRTQVGQDVAGTVTYMAPEQLQGKPGPASDQYALAVVTYEWLSGDTPFHGRAFEAATQHMLATPPSLREKVPTLSSSVELVVMKALEKDSHKRFSSVQTFAAALEQVSLGETSQQIKSLHPLIDIKSAVEPEQTQYLKTSHDAIALSSYQTEAISRTPVRPSAPSSTVPGALHITYRGHHATVTTVAWSPDSKRIASGSHDQTVQIWNVEQMEQNEQTRLTPLQGSVLMCRGHAGLVSAVAWSPEGQNLASSSWDATVQTWETLSGNRVLTYREHTKSVTALAWSSDTHNPLLASGAYDQTVRVWKATTGEHIFTYTGHSSGVAAVAWSPQGKRIASGGYDQTVQVWDATTGGHVFTYHGHSGAVLSIAWSPNGKRIASASRDGTVQVWDESKSAGILPKSKSLTYRGHTGAVYTLSWSPDGKHVASGGKDGTVQIWDATTGNSVFVYRGHSAGVTSVAWSPDGTSIASASEDKTVKVWVAP
jgi:eukaryotic-like serine/threonine-protein kinase